MKKLVTIVFFLLFHSFLFAQQFSQYNTGTLYDSFENPSQKSFTPDSSRSVGFNLFVPNFNVDFVLNGNAQTLFKKRVFAGKYDESSLQIGQGRFNYLNADVNAYLFMLKVYTSLKGDEEVGFSIQTRGEGRGVFSDESAQFLGNNSSFGDAPLTDIMNLNFNYQAYHQIGFTYRRSLTNQFSFGVKLSGLFGIVYNKLIIDHSYLSFDRPGDQAFISLAGKYYASFEPGKFGKSDLLPSTKNPGASISAGATYMANDGMKMQWNVKDLGFIHWNSRSVVGAFNNTGVIQGLSTLEYEHNLAKTVSSVVQNQGSQQGFYTPTDSRAEFSASKSYRLGYSSIKYTPTVILSKELFYTGFTAALVNHFQHGNFVGTLTSSFDDSRIFNFGGQLMVKTPNAEFFIGSDRLLQTAGLARSAMNKNSSQISSNGEFSGGNIFMGFSMKIGSVIEHPANASTIPMSEERSFFKRFWQRITKKED